MNSWLNVGRARALFLVLTWTSPVLSPGTSCHIQFFWYVSSFSILQFWWGRHLGRSYLCPLGAWDQVYRKYAMSCRKLRALLYAWTAVDVCICDKIHRPRCAVCAPRARPCAQNNSCSELWQSLRCICIHPSVNRRIGIFLQQKILSDYATDALMWGILQSAREI